MAQTEMTVRILKDGKPIGVLRIRPGGVRFRAFNGPYMFPDQDDEVIDIRQLKFDSFELGVKFNGDWAFDGDTMEVEDSQGKTWECEIAVKPNLHLLTSSRYSIQPIKVIGNIHEEKDNCTD